MSRRSGEKSAPPSGSRLPTIRSALGVGPRQMATAPFPPAGPALAAGACLIGMRTWPARDPGLPSRPSRAKKGSRGSRRQGEGEHKKPLRSAVGSGGVGEKNPNGLSVRQTSSPPRAAPGNACPAPPVALIGCVSLSIDCSWILSPPPDRFGHWGADEYGRARGGSSPRALRRTRGTHAASPRRRAQAPH